MFDLKENNGKLKTLYLFILAFKSNGETNLLSHKGLDILPFLGDHSHFLSIFQQEGNAAQKGKQKTKKKCW